MFQAMDNGMRKPIFGDFEATMAASASGTAADRSSGSCDDNEEQRQPIRVEVMDFLTKRDPAAETKGWLLNNALSAAECSALISASEGKGYQDAHEYCFMYARRQNDRMMCDDEQLASYLWEKVAPHFPNELSFGTGSTWKAYGLNKRFRICRYSTGGHFGIHTDGTFAYDSNDRSFLTCMFYLNEGGGVDFDGGTTDFVENTNEREAQYSLVAKTGRCVVFCQADMDCLHCGKELTSGTKYILRTDVMFKRKAVA